MVVRQTLNGCLQRLQASLRVALPLQHRGWLLAAILIGWGAGLAMLRLQSSPLDEWLYDRIVSQSQRPLAQHTLRVALDEGMPDNVSREQSLTLYALAAERLLQLGAEQILLDAQITLRNWRKQTFAACIEQNRAQWCQLGNTTSPCSSSSGNARQAPLDFDADVRQRVSMPYPLSQRDPPPLDWLFGRSQTQLPAFVSTALPASADGIVREVFADRDAFLSPWQHRFRLLQPCRDGSGRACQALRFSATPEVLPLSQLASCGTEWHRWKNHLRGKTLILQMTSTDESTDLHLTPMHTLRSGSWLIADAIESALQNDAPRPLPGWACILLILSIAPLTALACAWIKPGWLFFGLLCLGLGVVHWAPRFQPWAYWPVTAILVTLACAAASMLLGHFWLHSRQHAILSRLVPPQTRQLLLNTRSTRFTRSKLTAVVLMSDLAGYTSLTNRLEDPQWLLLLLDRYLNFVTRDLQQHYGGWLENYVADMVCYFWPVLAHGKFRQNQNEARERALAAALVLVERQQTFFAELPLHMPELDAENLAYVQANLYAGVAVCEGDVVLGEFGPDHGSRKFGILGDPANHASRLESLTRLFRGRLLISEELHETAASMGLPVRRLAKIQVKGRATASNVWAIQCHDKSITQADIDAWHEWLAQLELGVATTPCPGPFRSDAEILLQWIAAGWWQADHGCFKLEAK